MIKIIFLLKLLYLISMIGLYIGDSPHCLLTVSITNLPAHYGARHHYVYVDCFVGLIKNAEVVFPVCFSYVTCGGE